MKIVKSFIVVLLIPMMGFMVSSCEKEESGLPELKVAEDDALTELMYDDVFQEVEDAMESMESIIYDGVKKSAGIETCKVITVEHPNDSTIWPRTITVDYGEGCTGPNGRTRSGKIIVVVNRKYMDEDYYRTISFENFYVDGYKVEGTKTVSNEGKNDSGNMYFSISLENGKVTSPEGKEITREYTRTREWVAGMDTPRYRRDDEYMITGSASGINREGLNYTRTIIEPLHISLNCRWIKSGVVEISADERETATLDYGDGTCDRFATLTVGDNTRIINLHR